MRSKAYQLFCPWLPKTAPRPTPFWSLRWQCRKSSLTGSRTKWKRDLEEEKMTVVKSPSDKSNQRLKIYLPKRAEIDVNIVSTIFGITTVTIKFTFFKITIRLTHGKQTFLIEFYICIGINTVYNETQEVGTLYIWHKLWPLATTWRISTHVIEIHNTGLDIVVGFVAIQHPVVHFSRWVGQMLGRELRDGLDVFFCQRHEVQHLQKCAAIVSAM